MKDILVVGIAGGTGSGKSTLTEEIVKRFGKDVSVIHHDNYYKSHHAMSYEERTRLNYDHPDAFETERLVEDLRALKQGRTIHCPVYDYSIHDRAEGEIEVKPNRVMILEGILIYADEALCDQMDIRIFVDTDADVRILRRIRRDVVERARTIDSVIDQYLDTVKPMHEKYVEPSKQRADIIVPRGGQNRVALDMLIRRIEAHLAEEKEK